MLVEANPLQWPKGRPRSANKDYAAFKCTLAKARDNILREVSLLCRGGANSNIVISSNLRLRKDGLPIADQAQPNDTGVAVYFTYRKNQVCFACDRWQKVEHNMQAVAKTIEALRGIARWGTGDMLEAAFTGFAALPDYSKGPPWWEVLGCAPNAIGVEIENAYRVKMRTAHPDLGGSNDAMAALNRARDEGHGQYALAKR